MRGWPAFTPFIGYGYVGLEQVDVEGSRYADYSGVWSEGKGECTIYSQKKVLVGLENTKQQNNKTETNQTAQNFFVFQTD